VSNYGGSDSGSSSAAAPSSTAAATSAAPATTAAPASTTPRPSQVVTSVLPGTTVIVTMPAAQNTGESSATPTASAKSSGSTNVAGIAAGVVVGVVAIAAICIGAFFFLRRRKRQAVEDEYKRSNQVNDFMGNGHERKAPNTGYSQMSDQRLDTEAAAGRRNSVGSIADDQDYSRRILRVSIERISLTLRKVKHTNAYIRSQTRIHRNKHCRVRRMNQAVADAESTKHIHGSLAPRDEIKTTVSEDTSEQKSSEFTPPAYVFQAIVPPATGDQGSSSQALSEMSPSSSASLLISC